MTSSNPTRHLAPARLAYQIGGASALVLLALQWLQAQLAPVTQPLSVGLGSLGNPGAEVALRVRIVDDGPEYWLSAAIIAYLVCHLMMCRRGVAWRAMSAAGWTTFILSQALLQPALAWLAAQSGAFGALGGNLLAWQLLFFVQQALIAWAGLTLAWRVSPPALTAPPPLSGAQAAGAMFGALSLLCLTAFWTTISAELEMRWVATREIGAFEHRLLVAWIVLVAIALIGGLSAWRGLRRGPAQVRPLRLFLAAVAALALGLLASVLLRAAAAALLPPAATRTPALAMALWLLVLGAYGWIAGRLARRFG